jgi:hypothetical protein
MSSSCLTSRDDKGRTVARTERPVFPETRWSRPSTESLGLLRTPRRRPAHDVGPGTLQWPHWAAVRRTQRGYRFRVHSTAGGRNSVLGTGAERPPRASPHAAGPRERHGEGRDPEVVEEQGAVLGRLRIRSVGNQNPWSFRRWGGLQPWDGDEVEIALVLSPEFWGWKDTCSTGSSTVRSTNSGSHMCSPPCRPRGRRCEDSAASDSNMSERRTFTVGGSWSSGWTLRLGPRRLTPKHRGNRLERI